jgi:predicted dehydrogenase
MARYRKAADIKVGVVGYGGAFNMGRHHLNEMKMAGMTPVAVCEIDPTRLTAATADFPGIETYATVDAMLGASDVNLVTIITPHNTHADIALRCLNAGKSVVCEKPLAITTGECDAMIAAAKKNKCVISTYHNRHWDGCILKAVEMIGGGAIGEVFRIDAHMGGFGKPGDWWRTSKTISGGILYDWGVHLLEYAMQILKGEKIAEVTGVAQSGHWAPQTAWKKDTNEDEALALVRFKSGKYLTLCISALNPLPSNKWLEIRGTKGSYAFDHGSWDLITFNENREKVVVSGASPASEGHKLYQNIADHLVKGEKLIITGEWARRPIHILDLANQSAKKGVALKAQYA